MADSTSYPAGPCLWRDDPRGRPCGRAFARRTWVREILPDGDWRWAEMPLCWQHYGRMRRSKEAVAVGRNAALSEEALGRARELRADGQTYAQIAKALGVDRRTIARRLESPYLPGNARPIRLVEESVAKLRPVRRPKKQGGRGGH